jgi:fatty-acyl-CoA synthase
MRVGLTVADFLNRGALVHGSRVAAVDEPDVPGSLGSLTYTELEARARGMALALDHLEVAHGERVAIVSPNSARFLTSYFGVSGFGRVLVPINFRLTAAEIGYIVEHSGASVLLYDPELTDVVADIDVPHRFALDGVDDVDVFAAAAPGRQPREWAGDEDATAG